MRVFLALLCLGISPLSHALDTISTPEIQDITARCVRFSEEQAKPKLMIMPRPLPLPEPVCGCALQAWQEAHPSPKAGPTVSDLQPAIVACLQQSDTDQPQ